MTLGFTDRRGVPPPDPNRPVVVFAQLVEARIKSILVVDKARVTAWVPRSQISIEEGAGSDGAMRPGQKLRLTMPAWLAEEKGLTVVIGEGQGRLF